MNKIDFITGLELPLNQLKQLIQLAQAYKAGQHLPKPAGTIITLLFANPSLRTRLSFESGMKKLSAAVNIVSVGDSWEFEYRDGAVMNGSTQEHIKEAARVIASYSDIIGLRKSDLMTRSAQQVTTAQWEELRQDIPIKQLARYSPKPVVNLESNMFHPCQALADMMTMTEHLGNVQQKKLVLTWAPHPKPLPLATPHSQLLMPATFGMNVVLACPPDYVLDADVMELAQQQATQSGGSVTVCHNQLEAMTNADVVIAKSWAAIPYIGQWEAEQQYRQQFSNWTVDTTKMAVTRQALFMHCLPVRRNVVVTDAVLDSEHSVIIQEAENRMWTQMALISLLLNYST